MEINHFKDMFVAELQELVSVEGQLADALLRMAGAASHPALKELLVHHRAETETQRDRLVTILHKHGSSPTAHTDQAMQAQIELLLERVAVYLVSWRSEIGLFISEVVKSWDTEVLTERLELVVGSDLQYIRMNGTIVGAIAGCLIFLASRLFG